MLSFLHARLGVSSYEKGNRVITDDRERMNAESSQLFFADSQTKRRNSLVRHVVLTLQAVGWPWVMMCCLATISCGRRPDMEKLAAIEFDAPTKTMLRMRVTAHNFQWRMQYPGPDGQLDTDDDVIAAQDLHLPVHAIIEVELRSSDYAYTFFLPHLDLLETAIPDDPFVFRFETDEPGKYELLGSQMCGYIHPLLLGDVVIHTRAGFSAWLSLVE